MESYNLYSLLSLNIMFVRTMNIICLKLARSQKNPYCYHAVLVCPFSLICNVPLCEYCIIYMLIHDQWKLCFHLKLFESEKKQRWLKVLVQESACNSGDPGSILGSRRSPGGGNGNPLQYSSLENLMDRGAGHAIVHGVAKRRTELSNSHTHTFSQKA